MSKTVNSRQPIGVYPVLALRPWNVVTPGIGAALPLGTILAYAKTHKQGMLGKYFDFKPMVNRYEPDWNYFLREAETKPPAVWLLSSYVWNYQENLHVARAIKERSPGALIIAGGPHIPAYEQDNRDFFQQHPYIDITSRGEGEFTLAEILETICESSSGLHADFSAVNGISFRRGDTIVRTPERIRTRNLEIFPSPYATGEFEHPSFNDLPIMVMETNRGCPFGCTFCDWGAATLQKFSLFPIERVMEDIEIIASKRAHSIYISDSNFGAFERDVAIAEAIAKAKKKYGLPELFGTSIAKNASPRVAEIFKILHKAKMVDAGLVSFQTTDKHTLEVINRSNISSEKHEKLISIFKKENMKLSSELMIGLPGQTVDTFRKDLQFFIDRKLVTIAYSTAVMPNAPMNDPEYRKKYNIVVDPDGYVVSTSSFTSEERMEMARLFLAFQFFYMCGVLKYYLYFLQLEHSIPVMDFIHQLMIAARADPQRYPMNYQLCKSILSLKHIWAPTLEWDQEEGAFLFNHLDSYYQEISHFARQHYGVVLDSSEERTLFEAHKAVMPVGGKVVPFSIRLEHDLVAYMEQIRSLENVEHKPDGFRRLREYPPGVLKIDALKSKTITSLGLLKFNRYSGAGWELRSALRF